ncbi:serine protease [Pseudorhodobacter antarcticus]|nr:serine protease [Pseudorhodobacter antarcticus]
MTLISLVLWSLSASILSAQTAPQPAAEDRAWIQIEAQPNLNLAQERASAYASAFSDVAGFQLPSGWYAVALGPYTPEAALTRLTQLRRDNLIPNDSFIANGEQFRGTFWPVGADPLTAPVRGEAAVATDPTVAPVTTAPIADAAPDAAPTKTVEIIVEPAPEPEPLGETLAEAQRSEQALTQDERKDLQTALQYFGFYTSTIDGAFGRGTRASMAAWQTANGFEATGVMTTQQRQQMFDRRTADIAELGLTPVVEQEAGIEINLPLALVTFDRYEPPFVHFVEKDNSGVRIVLISEPGDRAVLRGLYDILQTLEVVPAVGERSITDSGFTINASSDALASHSFVELSGGLIKGYMLIWTPAAADKAARAQAAMQSSFKTIRGRALDPGLVSLDDAQRRNLLAGMEVRKPKLSRSGFFVSPAGAVLTTAEVVQSCGRITLDRDIEATVTAQDDTAGLVLLMPTKPLAPRFVAEFGSGSIGTEIALAGYSYEDALPAPTLTFGALADTKGLDGETGIARLSLASLPGDAGGPVVDAKGAVIGMLIPATAPQGRVLPAEVSFLADTTAITALLTTSGIPPKTAPRAAPLPPGDLTDLAMSLTVLVSCWE